MGTNLSQNLRTNLGLHQIWGRICPEIWGLILGFTKFGDEFVPKFEDKFGDSPKFRDEFASEIGGKFGVSPNLGINSPLNEGTNLVTELS